MKHKILLIIGILIHILIYTQSLLPADISAGQSGIIIGVLHPFITKLGISIDIDTFSFVIRKLAHFTEFFFLGLFWYFIYSKYHQQTKLIIITLLHGLITAILDETIQLFVDGRSGEITDVLIDFSGVLLAVISIHVIMTILNEKRKENF